MGPELSKFIGKVVVSWVPTWLALLARKLGFRKGAALEVGK